MFATVWQDPTLSSSTCEGSMTTTGGSSGGHGAEIVWFTNPSSNRDRVARGGDVVFTPTPHVYFFVRRTTNGIVVIQERIEITFPPTARLAVHACRMKMAGFAVSPYMPSTYTMAGAGH
jgi:hypothetical protein